MIQITSLKGNLILVVFVMLLSIELSAQQDPQYTQYMYNTMSVNPGYAGQREVLSISGLYRTQWVGLDGAPKTQTFAVHSPLRNENLGLGLSIVNDAIGPADEFYIDANFSYSIYLSDGYTKLSFGLKAGMHLLSTDWSKGIYQDVDKVFNDDISLFSPTIGAGFYLHSDRWYVGLSVPDFITTKHYSDYQESVAAERMHFYLIGGYVFELNDRLKFKPASLVKAVSGAPLIVDLSANFLINDIITLGAGWRWDDSVSALAGFQISDGLFLGYSYDATTTGLRNYNSGSHEIMLRFELEKVGRLLSPRFF